MIASPMAPLQLELRVLHPLDSRERFDELWEMIEEIGPGEHGFQNDAAASGRDGFSAWIDERHRWSLGLGVPDHLVPSTVYWAYAEGRPVGVSKLRHRLTDRLFAFGGHIGYSIRPSARGRGFGRAMLFAVLERAREKGIDLALVTCHEANEASRRVIEANGGELLDIGSEGCRYWIRT